MILHKPDAIALAVILAGVLALLIHAGWTVVGVILFLGLEASA